MNLIEAIQPYREPKTKAVVGVKNPPDHSCDNALLFSSIYIVLLKEQTDVSAFQYADECEWFEDFVKSSWVPDHSGLLCRYPGWFGPGKEEQHDDYRGVMAAAKAIGSHEISVPIVLEGELNRFCWNTEYPGVFDVRYCFDRFPGFVAALRASAGDGLSIADQLSFAASCLSVFWQKPGDTTGTMLQWLACVSVAGSGALADLSAAVWRARAKKLWPGGLSQVLSSYFNNPEHPLAIYAPKDFS